eukprot:scaffold10294_cov118-Isochrysis_galbana.AAC.3
MHRERRSETHSHTAKISSLSPCRAHTPIASILTTVPPSNGPDRSRTARPPGATTPSGPMPRGG